MTIYTDEKAKIEVTDYYYKLTIGDETWYWNKDTGKYDGHSKKVG